MDAVERITNPEPGEKSLPEPSPSRAFDGSGDDDSVALDILLLLENQLPGDGFVEHGRGVPLTEIILVKIVLIGGASCFEPRWVGRPSTGWEEFMSLSPRSIKTVWRGRWNRSTAVSRLARDTG